MRRSLSNNLNWLLSASTVSNLADGIAKVAFPLLAADLTRDPVLIAGLSATQFLPWLLFGVLAGGLLDRVDRRTAIIAANLGRAGAIGLLAGMIYLDAVNIFVIYAAALLVGTAETVADSAANVLIPAVVGRNRLESANSKLQATEIVGQTFLGGPIGSLSYALFAAFPFLLDTAGFAVAAVLLFGMAGNFRPSTAPATDQPGEQAGQVAPTRKLRTELADGLRWLRHNGVMSRLVIIAGLVSLTSELAQAQLVLYALEDLELTEAAFGVFAFVGGIGGLLGAAIAPRLINALSRLSVLLSGIVTAGVGFGAMGLSDHTVVSALLFGLFAAGVVAVNVVLATVRHSVVPGELLGRVLGVWRTAVWGAIPIGALLGGVLTELLGTPSATFRVSGMLLIAVALVSWLLLRGYRASVEPASFAPSERI